MTDSWWENWERARKKSRQRRVQEREKELKREQQREASRTFQASFNEQFGVANNSFEAGKESSTSVYQQYGNGAKESYREEVARHYGHLNRGESNTGAPLNRQMGGPGHHQKVRRATNSSALPSRGESSSSDGGKDSSVQSGSGIRRPF